MIQQRGRDFKNIIFNSKKFGCVVAIISILSGCAALTGRETVGEYVDDATITTAVKSNLLQDKRVKATQIHVETFQNTVQLSGFVDSFYESQQAAQIARNTQGVQKVENNLVVRKKRS